MSSLKLAHCSNNMTLLRRGLAHLLIYAVACVLIHNIGPVPWEICIYRRDDAADTGGYPQAEMTRVICTCRRQASYWLWQPPDSRPRALDSNRTAGFCSIQTTRSPDQSQLPMMSCWIEWSARQAWAGWHMQSGDLALHSHRIYQVHTKFMSMHTYTWYSPLPLYEYNQQQMTS